MQNQWASAPSAWVLLIDLLDIVQRDTAVARADAAHALRAPLELGEIAAEAQKDLLPLTVNEPPHLLDLNVPLERGEFKPMTTTDWQRLAWEAGTLDGAPIRVSRADALKVMNAIVAQSRGADARAAIRRRRRGNRPRGRRPKYHWEPVITGLARKLVADSAPADGDGGQAKLEKWVADHFPPDRQPSESVIRAKVAEQVRLFRKELDKGR